MGSYARRAGIFGSDRLVMGSDKFFNLGTVSVIFSFKSKRCQYLPSLIVGFRTNRLEAVGESEVCRESEVVPSR